MKTATPKKVLVVEDEVLVNWDVADALRDDGFEVLQAFSGEQALDMLLRHRDVGVVFTDINLPGAVDGLMLAEEIEHRWPGVEVLVTSGNHMALVDRLESIRNFGRFVPKPYPVKAVTRRIHEIIESHAAA
ncbi:MAG TPA: response regulator [Bauldia sp.]|nr:response regulator [Bauldia sp.]